MEHYIKDEGDITYKSELTPHHFLWMAGIYSLRARSEIYPLVLSKKCFFKKWWGVNSQTPVTYLTRMAITYGARSTT